MNSDAASAGGAGVPEPPQTIGVHVLSEFVFCPRAGLIAMGQERIDEGDDYWLRPNLDYKPSFTLYELRRSIVASLATAIAIGVCFGLVFAGSASLLREGMTPAAVGGVMLLIVLAWPLSRSLARLGGLAGEWIRIASLRPHEPTPDFGLSEPVVWWELLRAGFDPLRPPEPLHVPSLGLSGRPWRVLRKGDIVVPVFRIEADGTDRPFPKHAIRAAAYCSLLEGTTGARSPYAVALFAGTYNGLTLPFTAEARERLETELSAARASLAPDVAIDPPLSTTICSGCPHAFPRVYRRGVSETFLFGGPVRPRGASSREGLVYHSTCGDQFGWNPPHVEAVVLGLTPASS